MAFVQLSALDVAFVQLSALDVAFVQLSALDVTFVLLFYLVSLVSFSVSNWYLSNYVPEK